MPQVWIVEDDEDIREIISYALNTADFEVMTFDSGAAFFAALDSNKYTTPDMIVLDIMMPGDDGLLVLKKLRQSSSYQAVPIIMLTAKSSEHDKIKGLDMGADDYLTKPFSVMELMSRIKALLRRSGFASTESNEYTFQSIKLNHANRTVFVGDDAITLTYKEYELLHYLLMNKSIVVTRDKILEAVWGYDYEGESRTLDMHIKRLRQKLGEAGRHITTVRNVGYKMGE